MHLPKFWRDRGTWNDTAVSLAITAGLVAGPLPGLALGSPRLLLAGLVLGPAAGFGLGLGAVMVLSTFFTGRK